MYKSSSNQSIYKIWNINYYSTLFSLQNTNYKQKWIHKKSIIKNILEKFKILDASVHEMMFSYSSISKVLLLFEDCVILYYHDVLEGEVRALASSACACHYLSTETLFTY